MGLGSSPEKNDQIEDVVTTQQLPEDLMQHVDPQTGFIDWKSLFNITGDTNVVGNVTQLGELEERIPLAGEIPNPSDVVASLPSLPSISNIGTVSPTGIINWNSVPGGFQPLPQTAGKSKRLYQLSQFHGGINQKSSPRDIADFECQEATNVTFSQVGRIKLIGDFHNTNWHDNGLSIQSSGAPKTALRGAAGYGFMEITAPSKLNASSGQSTIVLTPDGDSVQADDSTVALGQFIDYAGDDNHDVAHVIYASGSGVYACDANFANTSNARMCAASVNRLDAGGNTVSFFSTGTKKPLIDSPTYDSDSDGAMVAGTVKCTHDGGTASVNGTVIADCAPTGTGTWNGTYYFYISWLFDGEVETGLTSFADDGGDDQASNGIAFSDEKLSFNLSVVHADAKRLGGDGRIEGARIYFKESGTGERFLLAEFNMKDGVKGALDSGFIPWTESSDVYNLASDIVFDSPPDVHTYLSLNTYYANEVYGDSKDALASTTAGPTSHSVRYKTAVVGQNGIVFIGNVEFQGTLLQDTMMYSAIGKPGVFPKLNSFDSPASDGSPITVLVAFQDTILQFKQNSMYVINISNPAQFYAEVVFKDCGVSNPCQVFQAPFGIIFANQKGCFIYDGQRVISLTGGKFNFTNWDLPTDEGSSVGSDSNGVPSVGYDPRSQSIIVLKDINDDSTDEGAWIYSIPTQSWTEADSFFPNADGTRWSNFFVTSDGLLSFFSFVTDHPLIYNYEHERTNFTNATCDYNDDQTIEHEAGFASREIAKDMLVYGTGIPTGAYVLSITDGNTFELSAATTGGSVINGTLTFGGQLITYWTKDIDFGLPSQTKKLFKVYITYKGDLSNLTVAYGINGETDTSDLYHFATDSYGGTTDTTPLEDKHSAGDLESWHVATLYPDESTAGEGKDWKSISLYFNGRVDGTFEINDISILYRVRPIK